MSRNENINTTKIEETIEKTEYGGTPRRRIGEIEMAEFTGFDEKGEPNEITYRRKKYKLETSKETLNSEGFFKHSIERDDNGNITKITFENESAKDLFDLVSGGLRRSSIKSIEEALRNELEMNSESVGSGNNLNFVEERIVKRFMRDITSGFEQASLSELMVIPNTINEFSTELGRFFENYFSKKNDTDKKSLTFPSNDWLSDINEMAINWIKQIQESDVEVSIRTTKAYLGTKPLVIRNVNVGKLDTSNNPAYEYINEQTALSGLLMSYENFGFTYREYIDVINYNLPSKRISEEESFVDRGVTPVHSEGKILLGITRHVRPIVELQYDEQDNITHALTINQIGILRRQYDLLHELGHSLDVVSIWHPSPQREGFATAFECGFNFNINKGILRNVLNYHGDVTKQQLIDSLSINPNMRSLVQAEIYGITSSFFSWLYENVGSENFVSFYTYLSGYKFNSGTSGIERAVDDLYTIKERSRYVDNVMESLGKIRKDHMWTWSSTDELIENFLDDINDRGGRKNKEKITSIS